jgi:hypothetical protein
MGWPIAEPVNADLAPPAPARRPPRQPEPPKAEGRMAEDAKPEAPTPEPTDNGEKK